MGTRYEVLQERRTEYCHVFAGNEYVKYENWKYILLIQNGRWMVQNFKHFLEMFIPNCNDTREQNRFYQSGDSYRKIVKTLHGFTEE
ncbi:hypothetical protein CEXT_289621 [Caerostris extrusa]|uniref:LAGLIDADG homing endonuclease n=1 Tax=Caerostris extrusa TaxID=172846 RepID=A0AAV4N1U3_CAEEX|nr:hypothetical protein CEXT_289621 [Caerostris extrusa]